MTGLLVVIVAGAVGVWLVVAYNRLVRLRNMVQEGWSGIAVQLKRRADLIPNLVETVTGYLSHEQKVLREVTTLRSQSLTAGGTAEKGRVEGLLSKALGNLFAVAESYPDLKANQNFLELQGRLAELEEQIQLARRYFNGAVRNLNIQVESFPSNLVARLFGFEAREYFELTSPEDRTVPGASFK